MYNPEASPLIEESNATVRELEIEADNQVVIFGAVSAPLRTELSISRQVLGALILSRTTAVGSVT